MNLIFILTLTSEYVLLFKLYQVGKEVSKIRSQDELNGGT
jgi:hypothetical protein